MSSSPVERPLIALIGNPNAGKTSVFNALTGSNQKVGNYPGVTVERCVGSMEIGGAAVDVVDVPGLYSMTAMSVDEQIAVGEIMGGEAKRRADLFVYVLDAGNLERNLFFFSQVRELGTPVIVAVTMLDVLEKGGVELNLELLKRKLRCPVIPVVAHRSRGIQELRTAMTEMVENPPESPPPPFESVEDRYRWAEDVRATCFREGSDRKWRKRMDQVDKIVTHRVWGLAIFLLIMYAMFQSIYTLAAPLMDLIDGGMGALGGWAGGVLEGTPWLQSVVVDGIIAGIGSVLVFLPQILILFFFIAALEGSGYLARASFLMDRVFGWCGLNGKAFIPLLSSFACAIPGIMSARIMPDARSRLVTILVAPLMSCSARLPVYILMIGAFIEPQYGPVVAGATLFGMHALGAVIAVPVIMVLNRRSIRKGIRLPFLMELPPYQWPKWRDVLGAMLDKAKGFIQTAGTIIFVMSILIWAMLYFPRSDEADRQYRTEYLGRSDEYRQTVSEENFVDGRRLEHSVLGQFGHAIEPAFRPAGFDWRISTAILAAFPAREVLVSSMGIIFDLGGDQDENSQDLRAALQNAKQRDGKPLFSSWTAFGLMAFFALCCQCGSTLAAMRRETNSWKWPLVAFVYMTGLAWVVAVVIHQIGLLLSR